METRPTDLIIDNSDAKPQMANRPVVMKSNNWGLLQEMSLRWKWLLSPSLYVSLSLSL